MSVERRSLGLMESTLLSALNSPAQALAGFEVKRFQAAREQLHAKRLRMMAKAWPSLPRALGDDWRQHAWAVLRDVRSRGDERAITDGFLVAKTLGMSGSLLPEVRIQMLLVRVEHQWRDGELVRRCQPAWLLNLISWAVGRLFLSYVAGDPNRRSGRAEGKSWRRRRR